MGKAISTAFLKNRTGLIIGEPKIVKIDRSTNFNPAEFIGAGWTIWKGPANGNGLEGEEDQDKRSLALTELDLTQVKFVDMLKSGESYINGEEKQKRLAQAGHIRLDANIARFLWNNKHLIPASWKERINGNTRYIYFDGTVLRNPNGYRFVLYLFWNDGKWYWYCHWLVYDFFADDPSAVLESP